MIDGVLDNPVWASLVGHHAPLAEIKGHVARLPADVSPFVGIADEAREPEVWRDLADLVGPGAAVALTGPFVEPPATWEVVNRLHGVQLVDKSVAAAADPEIQVLGPADVPDMLDLATRTAPGPFFARTIEFGTYLGIRRDGVLVAMAGERLRPPGWTEVSAVCTDSAHRGQGLSTRLMRAVVHGIRERGETAFLQAAADNAAAIRLYGSLGFALRSHPMFVFARTPR